MKLGLAALLIVMRGALTVSASSLSHTHESRELWDKLDPSEYTTWRIVRKEGGEVYLGLINTSGSGFTPKQARDIGEKKCKLVVIRQPTNLFPLTKDAELEGAIERSFECLKETTRATIAYGTINPISNDSEGLKLFWREIFVDGGSKKFYDFRTTSIEYLKEMFESESFKNLVEVQKQLFKEYFVWRGSEFSSEALKQFGESYEEFIKSAVESQQKIEDMTGVFMMLAKDLEEIVEMVEKTGPKDEFLPREAQKNAEKRAKEAKSLLGRVEEVEGKRKKAFDEVRKKNMKESKVLEAFIAWVVACHLKIRALDLLANADSMASEANDLLEKLSNSLKSSGTAKNKDEGTVVASESNPEALPTPGSEGASKIEPTKELGEEERTSDVEVKREKSDEPGTSTAATQGEEEGASDIDVETKKLDEPETSTVVSQKEGGEKSDVGVEGEKSNEPGTSTVATQEEGGGTSDVKVEREESNEPGTPPTQEEEKSDKEPAPTEEVPGTSTATTQGEEEGASDKELEPTEEVPGTSKGAVSEELAPIGTKKGGFGRRLGKIARSTMKKLGLGKKK